MFSIDIPHAKAWCYSVGFYSSSICCIRCSISCSSSNLLFDSKRDIFSNKRWVLLSLSRSHSSCTCLIASETTCMSAWIVLALICHSSTSISKPLAGSRSSLSFMRICMSNFFCCVVFFSPIFYIYV